MRLFPFEPDLFGNPGESVPGKIDEVQCFSDSIEIDNLRAPGRLLVWANSFCPNRALIKLDLPTLLRPKKQSPDAPPSEMHRLGSAQ